MREVFWVCKSSGDLSRVPSTHSYGCGSAPPGLGGGRRRERYPAITKAPTRAQGRGGLPEHRPLVRGDVDHPLEITQSTDASATGGCSMRLSRNFTTEPCRSAENHLPTAVQYRVRRSPRTRFVQRQGFGRDYVIQVIWQ